MFVVTVLRYALFLLLPLSIVSTTYLYLYPIIHLCAFPAPEPLVHSPYLDTLRSHLSLPAGGDTLSHGAPFRLLALGDPQLEGDTSLPDPDADPFPHFSSLRANSFYEDEGNFFRRLRSNLHDLIDLSFEDVPAYLDGIRKSIDLVGNDLYLAHIYRTLHWWSRPTHVSVLGDLLGSQWVDEGEFESRSGRFWNNVFKNGERLPDELMVERADGDESALILGDDAIAWTKRIINIAGNHDVGYAGDMDQERLDRFEHAFGKANYELRFHLPPAIYNATFEGEFAVEPRDIPELRIVVFNDMNLDTPVGSPELQTKTYEFLNRVITQSHHVERTGMFTLLLTHIPMYKEEGVCVDPPFFDFFDGEYGNGVKEQNHLSLPASKAFLEGLFGMSGNTNVDGQGRGRKGLVVVGHDHEGCDVWHFINQTNPIPDPVFANHINPTDSDAAGDGEHIKSTMEDRPFNASNIVISEDMEVLVASNMSEAVAVEVPAGLLSDVDLTSTSTIDSSPLDSDVRFVDRALDLENTPVETEPTNPADSALAPISPKELSTEATSTSVQQSEEEPPHVSTEISVVETANSTPFSDDLPMTIIACPVCGHSIPLDNEGHVISSAILAVPEQANLSEEQSAAVETHSSTTEELTQETEAPQEQEIASEFTSDDGSVEDSVLKDDHQGEPTDTREASDELPTESLDNPTTSTITILVEPFMPTWTAIHHTALPSLSQKPSQKKAVRNKHPLQNPLTSAPHTPAMREITLRSMMGSFGGSAGLLSLWFNQTTWEWEYAFDTCAMGTQHVWWFVHIVDLITVGAILLWAIGRSMERAIDLIHPADSQPSSKKPAVKVIVADDWRAKENREAIKAMEWMSKTINAKPGSGTAKESEKEAVAHQSAEFDWK